MADACRTYIQNNYASIKSSHPELKLLVREASGVEPKAFIRFGKSVVADI